MLPAWTGCHGGQADGCSIADGTESFQSIRRRRDAAPLTSFDFKTHQIRMVSN
jgi:hypothetical protein